MICSHKWEYKCNVGKMKDDEYKAYKCSKCSATKVVK